MLISKIDQKLDTLIENAVDIFKNIGEIIHNLVLSFKYILKGKIDLNKVVEQTALIGFDSLPITVLICLIAGSVLALQTAEKFALTGADDYVGGLVALAIVREMGPIFACLTIGARSGTAIAAEIANMQVTEQVDALRVMQISPVRYLVVPRLLACVFALPLLTLVGESVAILGGMFIANQTSNLRYSKYLDSVWVYLGRSDVMFSLIKAIIFGFLVAAISCTIGLLAKGGARDVGLSTTKAVVWISVTILITDFFLSWVFFGTSWDGM